MAEAGSVWVSVIPSLKGFTTKVRSELRGLDVNVGVNVDTRAAKAEIADATRGQDVKVGMKVDTAGATRELSTWSKLAGRMAQVNVNVGLDKKSLGDSIVGVAALSRALGTLSAPAAIVAATPYLLSLGSSAVQAAGSLALLPAAAGAGALAVGTLKVAFQGFGDAIGDDPKKAAEAMAKMAPAAREAAMAVNGLKPAWQALQLDVQSRMFAGLSGQISGLGTTYIPILRGAMAGLAADINGGVAASFAVLRREANVNGISMGLGHVRVGLGATTQALAPLTQAFTTLFIHGAPYIARFGFWVRDSALAFASFIDQAGRTGQITVWINNAILVFQQLGAIGRNVGLILGSMFGAARSSGESFLGVLVRVTGSIATALRTPEGAAGLTQFFTAIRGLVSAFIERVIILWPLISTLAITFFNLLQAAGPLLDVVFRLVVMALTPMVHVLNWMAPVLGPIIAAFWLLNAASSAGALIVGAKAAALWVLNGAMVAVRIATMIWTGVQWALNVALSANPIGLVIIALTALVAGVIYAYNNFGWFRDIVNAAWSAIQTATSFAWNSVIKPIFSFISLGVQQVGAVWTAVWQGISNFAVMIWTFIAAYFTGAFNSYVAVFSFIWNTVSSIFSAVWNGIRNTAVILWTAISTFFTVGLQVFSAFWGAVWTGISNFFSAIWNAIRNTAVSIWNSIAGFFGAALNAFSAFWSNIWNGIVRFFGDAWNRITQTGVNAWNALASFFGRAFAAFTGFFIRTWDNIRDAFGRAFSGIIRIAEDIWARVKGVFAGGLNAIIRGVNWPIDKINVTFGISIPTIPQVPAFANGGILQFANGGVRRENHRPQITRAGGPMRVWSEPETGGEAYIPMGQRKRSKALPVLGTVADRFGYGIVPKGDPRFYADGGVEHFADGGLWRRLAGVAQGLVGGTRVSSNYRPGDPGYHGQGKAVDLVGNMPAINRAIAQRFPNSTQLIYTPGINLFRGRPHRYNAATRADHFDHVHWAMENEAMLSGAPGNYDGGGGFFDIGALLDPIKALGKAALKGLIPDNPTWMEPLGVSVYDKMWDGLKAKAMDLMASFMGTSGGGAEQWRGTALQALAMTGQPASFVDRVLQQIMIESGGNARAINLWDSNARKGTPSKGLIQTIDPTFRAYRHPALPNDPYNPLANIVAGIRYTISRYGSLMKWPVRGGYDEGGIASGVGYMPKYTLRPERVLSPRQTQAFERLVPMLSSMQRRGQGIGPGVYDGMSGAGGGPAIGTVYQQLPEGVSARRMVEELTHEVRRTGMAAGVHGR